MQSHQTLEQKRIEELNDLLNNIGGLNTHNGYIRAETTFKGQNLLQAAKSGVNFNQGYSAVDCLDQPHFANLILYNI